MVTDNTPNYSSAPSSFRTPSSSALMCVNVFNDTKTEEGELALAIQETDELIKDMNADWDATLNQFALQAKQQNETLELRQALAETDEMINVIEKKWNYHVQDMAMQKKVPGYNPMVQKTMEETDLILQKINEDIAIIMKNETLPRLIPAWQATKTGQALKYDYDQIVRLKKDIAQAVDWHKNRRSGYTKRKKWWEIKRMQRDLVRRQISYSTNYLASLPLRAVLKGKDVHPELRGRILNWSHTFPIKLSMDYKTGKVISDNFTISIPHAVQLEVNQSGQIFAVVDVYGDAHIFNLAGQKLWDIPKEYTYLTNKVSGYSKDNQGFLLSVSNDAVFTVNSYGQIYRHEFNENPVLIGEVLKPVHDLSVDSDGMRLQIYYEARQILNKEKPEVWNAVYNAGQALTEADQQEIHFKPGPVLEKNKTLFNSILNEFAKVLGDAPNKKDMDNLNLLLLKSVQAKARNPKAPFKIEDRFIILNTRQGAGLQYALTDLSPFFTTREIQELVTKAASMHK